MHNRDTLDPYAYEEHILTFVVVPWLMAGIKTFSNHFSTQWNASWEQSFWKVECKDRLSMFQAHGTVLSPVIPPLSPSCRQIWQESSAATPQGLGVSPLLKELAGFLVCVWVYYFFLFINLLTVPHNPSGSFLAVWFIGLKVNGKNKFSLCIVRANHFSLLLSCREAQCDGYQVYCQVGFHKQQGNCFNI